MVTFCQIMPSNDLWCMSAVFNVITIKPYQYPKVSVKNLISLCASLIRAINLVLYYIGW